MTPKHAAIYARISDDRTGEEAGVKRQLSDCRDLAKRRGWEIVDEYVDNDLSAWTGRPRPEYQRLLDDIRSKRITGVVTWHLDRLHRRPIELEHFIEACDAAKLRHVITVTGDVDMASDDGLFNARIQTAVARKSSDDMKRRIRRKHEELAKAGALSGGGTRPYGYQADRIAIDKAEAKNIRAAVKAIIAGRSVRSIADGWAKKGIRSPAGSVFGPSALRRLLRSGRIAGRREHRGEVVGKAIWRPIISQANHERVRAILSDPSRLTRRPGRKYLLGGFLVCGKCGALLKSRPASSGTRLYICKTGPGAKGCGGIGIVAEPLEELIAEEVFDAVDKRAFAKAMAEQERAVDAGSAEDIAADEAQLTQLAEDFAQRRIGRAEWLRVRDIVAARLDEARRRLARENGTEAVHGYVGRPGALRAAWGLMNLEERRTVLRALIDRIVIAPAKKKRAPTDEKGHRVFDPGRVTVEWRF